MTNVVQVKGGPIRVAQVKTVALVAALMVVMSGCGESPQVAPEQEVTPAATPVDVVVMTPESVRDEIVVPAEIEPARRATLAAEAGGRVEALVGDLGDRVAAGRGLVTLDRRSANEALAEAVAVERQARLQRERAEALLERRSITKAQLLDAVTAHEVALARLASARLALAHTTVVAPWAGEIAARRVEVGDYVVPGQAVIDLVDRSHLIVRAAVPANDAGLIEAGAEVSVIVAARPELPLAARLIRRAPAIDPVSRTLEIEAELVSDLVLPGEPARLAVVRRELEGVLLVPTTALIELAEGQAVYVAEDGVARRRVVELGVSVGERVVVTSGLEAGDRVVVRGQDRIADGQPVVEKNP